MKIESILPFCSGLGSRRNEITPGSDFLLLNAGPGSLR
jgi:hypothetical protein